MNPFDQAWTLLKQDTRQSTLGEYHADFPSPHGDVEWYHGTTVGPAAKINTEGLKPAEPWYDGYDNRKGVYASQDLEMARQYASMRGSDRNQAGRVYGIRQGVPQQPIQPIGSEYSDNTRLRFDQKIPREYLVPV